MITLKSNNRKWAKFGFAILIDTTIYLKTYYWYNELISWFINILWLYKQEKDWRWWKISIQRFSMIYQSGKFEIWDFLLVKIELKHFSLIRQKYSEYLSLGFLCHYVKYITCFLANGNINAQEEVFHPFKIIRLNWFEGRK